MLRCTIDDAACYRHAQQTSFTTKHVICSLILQGIEVCTSAGQTIGPSDLPCLRWNLPGEQVLLKANSKRLNWVVLLQGKTFTTLPGQQYIGVNCANTILPIPRLLRLRPDEADHYADCMQSICTYHHGGSPRESLQASLAFAGMLSKVLGHEQSPQPQHLDDATRLKQALDADPQQIYSLAAHARTLGRSPDHLRRCFSERYGIGPKQYRDRRRAAVIMQQIINTQANLTELAQRLRFNRVSQMNALFKRCYGISPQTAIKRHRHA